MTGSVTPNKHLPLMEASQSQPETIYNAAMELLDGDTFSDSGGGSLTVGLLTGIHTLTFDGDVSVAAGGAGEAVVTIAPISGGAGSGGNVTPDSHPTSPDTTNDEFEAGSLNVKWVWQNQGSATADLENGSLILTSDIVNSRNMRTIHQALPVGDCVFRSKLSFRVGGDSNNAGMVMRESATGKMLRFAFAHYSAVSYFDLSYYSNDTTSGGAVNQFTPFPFDVVNNMTDWLYYELAISGSNILVSLSKTGIPGSFTLYNTVAFTTPFTTGPDQVGLFVESFSATTAAVLFADWFRRTA